VNTMAFVRGLTGLAAATAVISSAGAARAHGGDEVERSPRESAGPGRGEQGESEDGGASGSREQFTLSMDLVLGWGKAPFAVQNLPTTGTQAITYTYSGATPSDVQSLLFAGSFEVNKHAAIGARLPLSFGTFSPEGSSPDGAAARSTNSFGNIEFEAVYGSRVPLSGVSTMRIVGSLGVALPTALGDEIPSDLTTRPASDVDVNAYDRFSLSRAAAMARGDEDDALFAPKRLGIVPKIALMYQGQSLRIEPSFKVENLLSTSTSLASPYLGEIVPAVRLGYRVRRVVELTLRAWANVRFAAATGDRQTTAAVEPGMALQLGSVVPYAGVILPLSGVPYSDSFLGVRLGVGGSF
jgi:hypothetical protein